MTIAEFISSMNGQIESVFTDVLTVCYAEGLIGKTMFALMGARSVLTRMSHKLSRIGEEWDVHHSSIAIR